MRDANTGRATWVGVPSVKSTWREVTRGGSPPLSLTPGHLDKEQALDHAYDEFCRLREHGSPISASQFCDRYPSYRRSLRRLIDVHDALDHQPHIEVEAWPELYSEFLGFQILHELGVGAIARVYLAIELALGGRLVAIKVSQHGGDEADTLGKLSHRNIVPVHSVQQDHETGMTAVCMPYFGSATLADLLDIGFQDGTAPERGAIVLDAAREREQLAEFLDQPEQPLATDPVLVRGSYVDAVIQLAIQMAEALEYTHAHGILHRDLKPSNVLLTSAGVPMLLDFNLATNIESETPRIGGTLPYMPPEQIHDVHLQPFQAEMSGDPRSDIFSLGVILYELLTGRLPFGDPAMSFVPREAAEAYLRAQQQPITPINQRNHAVPTSIAKAIERCLSFDLDQRPQSATALVQELRKHFSRRQRLVGWVARHVRLVVGLALLTTISIALPTWHLATRPPYEIREYRAALTDFDREQYTEAAERLSALLQSHETAEALFARGVSYQRAGEHDRACVDFERALALKNAPIIRECFAYSALHLPRSERSRVAIPLYESLNKQWGSHPDRELNQAYAYLQWGNQPRRVVTLATNALKLGTNNPQAAYHLRALGWERSAGPSESAAAQERAINQAIEDIELALAHGLSTPRLSYDAARIYAKSSHPNADERCRELLETSNTSAIPRLFIESLARDWKPEWIESAWFGNLLRECSVKNTFDGATPTDLFLTSADNSRVRQSISELPDGS